MTIVYIVHEKYRYIKQIRTIAWYVMCLTIDRLEDKYENYNNNVK